MQDTRWSARQDKGYTSQDKAHGRTHGGELKYIVGQGKTYQGRTSGIHCKTRDKAGHQTRQVVRSRKKGE